MMLGRTETSTIGTKTMGRARWMLLACAAMLPLPMHAADTFMKPTKEELAMTSLPGYPGAPAVVLFREDITKDDLHVHQIYDRIKILTEEGKSYANVELPFVSSMDHDEYTGDDKMVDTILGRTIHPDGTIIPFTGKPYLKVVEKTKGYKMQEKVFTLPDVEVGSIIEYRYSERINDRIFEAPDWFIQGNLYLKAAHYVWYPTTVELQDGQTGDPINAISWFPILPADTKLEHRDLPANGPGGRPSQIYELTVKDVAPQQKEEYMPPIASFTYRVLFNMTAYRSAADYWKGVGKQWSKGVDKFAGPSSSLRAATDTIIAGAATPDEKLHKIYDAVMALENTSYTREHSGSEDKVSGLGTVDNAGDVLTHKRGNSTQLTELFLGMARAAGFKAYAMLVPDRSERLFTASWLNMSQFDNMIVIVNVNGKDTFFDPGTRYCQYGHLAWESTVVAGLRQTDGGTDFAQTPGEAYTFNVTKRAANLTMAEDGSVKGTIELSIGGSSALNWRKRALRGDAESLRNGLRSDMERKLPKTLEVKVVDVKNVTDYEKPLLVNYEIKGSIGTPTGKRLVMPVELFMANSTAAFPHEKRDLAVYFPYGESVLDAVRVNFPKNLALEASPASAKYDMKGVAAYGLSVEPTATNITVRRQYAFGSIVILPANYAALRTYFSQFEAKDQESVVLKQVSADAAPAAAPGAN